MTTTRLRQRFGLAIGIVLMLSELCVAQPDKPAPAKPKPAWPVPKITISKETTWATEPVGVDGFIDYLEVVNRRHSQDVTIENNAAVLLYQALGPSPDGTRQPDQFFRRMGIEPPPDDGMYFQLGQHFGEALFEAMERPWATQEFPEIADWLRGNATALLAVTEAVERPRYFSPLVVSDAKPNAAMMDVALPGVQQSRGVGRALAARAMRHLAEGSQLDAWRDLMTIHRLGRLIGQGPTVIEYLAGAGIEAIAIEGELRFLSATKPSAKLFAMYRKPLDRLPPLATVADKLDVERLMFLDTAHRLARGQMRLEPIALTLETLEGGIKDDLITTLAKDSVIQSVQWDAVLRSANQWYDRLGETARIADYCDRADALRQFDQDVKELIVKRRVTADIPALLKGQAGMNEAMSDVLISLLNPSNNQICYAEGRAIQRMRNLEIAFALAHWRSEHDSYPDSLEMLAPKYVATVPNDIFNGRPMNYERTAEGFRITSVGPNKKNFVARNNDLVVRMPMPKKLHNLIKLPRKLP